MIAKVRLTGADPDNEDQPKEHKLPWRTGRIRAPNKFQNINVAAESAITPYVDNTPKGVDQSNAKLIPMRLTSAKLIPMRLESVPEKKANEIIEYGKDVEGLCERKTFLVRLEGEHRGNLVFDHRASRGSVYVLGFEKEEVGCLLQQPRKVHKDFGVHYNRKQIFLVIPEDSVKWVEVGRVVARSLRKKGVATIVPFLGGKGLRRWSPKENSKVEGKFRGGWIELRGEDKNCNEGSVSSPALIKVIDGDWVFTMFIAVIGDEEVVEGRRRDLDQRLEGFRVGEVGRKKKGEERRSADVLPVGTRAKSGPLRLGQGEGEKKTSEKQVPPQREEATIGGKGKGVPDDHDVQDERIREEGSEVWFKEAVEYPISPSSNRRQGSRSYNEPLLLEKPSSDSEELPKEEAFREGAQWERGFSASLIFFCRSPRIRCLGEGASSSRDEEVVRDLQVRKPFFEEDREGLLGRVGPMFVVLQLRSCLLIQKSESACSNQLPESFNPIKTKPILPSEVSNRVTGSQVMLGSPHQASSKLKACLPGKWLKCVRFYALWILRYIPEGRTNALQVGFPFTEEEIYKAIFQLDRDKASGPDGFTIAVFQDCWDVIKEDLVRVFAEFHSSGIINQSTNASFIVLLPKKSMTKKISDFRPISLITSLYKIIAKVLSGRLRGWKKWMRGCLSTVSFAILVNGNAKGWVKASRGLRQGDPLSPFVYFSRRCTEQMLLRAEERNSLEGFRVDSQEFIASVWAYFGLKVNLDKSNIYGINLEQNHLSRLAELLDCKASGWPMPYLGLPLGGNPKACGFWDPVIERISRRLDGWQKAYLSFGVEGKGLGFGKIVLRNRSLREMVVEMVTSLSLEGYCTSLLGVFQVYSVCGRRWRKNSVLGRLVFSLLSFFGILKSLSKSSPLSGWWHTRRHEESADHLFLHCSSTMELWHRLFQLAKTDWVPPMSISNMLSINYNGFGLSKGGTVLWQATCIAIIWVVWRERNARIFEDKARNSENL
ncbi:Transposon TX1 uncharacterized 149 kDa protein [Vitis vinifera]|uniref:Transposon TX1 uncharacterized 149 kDa protein n=1 Tax=Vitis vinifera TaxID=29760 RepID=A0A438H3F3_VITVI|nr:Transposon TX1 uncharacterized 149 kDa protein [Vitis vinifera]